MPLTDEEIKSRIHIGSLWMKKHASVDREACRKFRDASVDPQWQAEGDSDDDLEGGDVLEEVPVGVTKPLTVNFLTGVAGVAVNEPDWRVKAHDGPPDPNTQQPTIPAREAEIVGREFLLSGFRKGNWKRVAQRAEMKRRVGGLGLACSYWNPDKGPCVELVQPWDFAVDPCITNWRDIPWAGRRIRMSLRRAKETYPDYKFWDATKDGQTLDSRKVSVWIYWDDADEVHLLADRGEGEGEAGAVLWRDPEGNQYGEVPIYAHEGTPDPGPSVFPISDHALAAGLEAEITDLNERTSNSAKNGGVITLINTVGMDRDVKQAIIDGKQQQFLMVKGDPKNMIHREEGEQLSPTILEARRTSQEGLDGLTGVTAGMRGQPSGAETATENAIIESRSGARSVQARVEYEQFLSRLGMSIIRLGALFGGPKTDKATGRTDSTDEATLLWRCLLLVQEVTVVEASTLYRDTSTDQQQAMQQYNLDLQSLPAYLQLLQLGMIDKIPNLQYSRDRMLKAFMIHDTEEAWTTPQAAPQQPQGRPPIENIDYRDAPPDVRRQMEAQAGLTPSQMGDAPEGGGQDAQAEGEQKAGLQQMAQGHEAGLQALQHAHELQLEQMKQAHAAEIKAAELAQQRKMGTAKGKSNGQGKS